MTTTTASFTSRVRHAIPGLRHVHGNPAPSPPQLPLIGHLPSSGIARLDILHKLAIELGPVVRFELPFVTAHLLSSPDAVERVLVKEHRLFSKKTRGYDQL